MRELLPCPYCGGVDLKDPTDEWLSDADSHWVNCYDCGCCGPSAERSEDAVSKWNALPRTLRWTKEPPTKPGWYWWREGRNEDRLVAHVFIGAHTSGQKYLYAQFAGEGDIVYKIKEMGGEFAGPIPEPKEK